MSANILWGEASLSGALQPLLTVDLAPILDVDNVPITTLIPFVTFDPILDVNGDDLLTVDNAPILAISQGAEPPSYWQTADVASDGGVPFGFEYETNPWQPDDQPGECVFAWADIGISWSMAAQVRFTPFTDGDQDPVTLADGSTIEIVPVAFTLPQAGAGLERRTEVFKVPIVRRHIRDGVEVARYYLRGERLQFLIESTGQLGSGELMLEGQAIEFSPVRKAKYAEFDASGGA